MPNNHKRSEHPTHNESTESVAESPVWQSAASMQPRPQTRSTCALHHTCQDARRHPETPPETPQFRFQTVVRQRDFDCSYKVCLLFQKHKVLITENKGSQYVSPVIP